MFKSPGDKSLRRRRSISYRLGRAFKWGFISWIATALVIGGFNGLTGFNVGHTYIPPSFENALWAVALAAVTAAPIVAGIAIVLGLTLGISNKQRAKLNSPIVPLGMDRILAAKEVAAKHLNNPVYVADYAKASGMNLLEAQEAIRLHHLSTFRHEGIAFVDGPKDENHRGN